MRTVSTAAWSGVQAATLSMGAAAHNIANVQTPQFRRQLVSQAAQSVSEGVSAKLDTADEEGADLAADMVWHRASSYSYIANLKVIKTEDSLVGTLVNMKA